VGKKIKGRKRHIVVDSLGNLLHVIIHAANVFDSIKGGIVAKEALERYEHLELFCADGGYQGTTVLYIIQELKKLIWISPKIKSPQVSPKRWIVERTFAWLGNFRRLVIDFEKSIHYAAEMIRIAMITIMLNKLDNSSCF